MKLLLGLLLAASLRAQCQQYGIGDKSRSDVACYTGLHLGKNAEFWVTFGFGGMEWPKIAFLLVGIRPLNIPVDCGRIYVDPFQVLVVDFVIPPVPSIVRIPSDATLVGASLFFQGAVTWSDCTVMSPGLLCTIQP